MNSSQSNFLPLSTTFPEDDQAFLIRLTSVYGDIAYRLNLRTIGVFDLAAQQTGESWYSASSSSPNNKRQPFRKIVQINSITGTATTSSPHGISTNGLIFSRIYGTLNDPNYSLFAPIPQSGPNDVSITVDATNVNVIASDNTYDGFFAIIVLEYLNKQ